MNTLQARLRDPPIGELAVGSVVAVEALLVTVEGEAVPGR